MCEWVGGRAGQGWVVHCEGLRKIARWMDVPLTTPNPVCARAQGNEFGHPEWIDFPRDDT